MLTALCTASLFIILGLTYVGIRLNARLKKAHKALQDMSASPNLSSEYERIACAHTDDGLLVQDLTGCILWANPAYCRIMGYTLDEILGRNPLEFALPPEDTPPQSFIDNFTFDPDDPQWEGLSLYENQRKSGERFWNQIRVSYDMAGANRVILVCRDVTHEVEQENKLRQKTAELAHIANHDPLTGAANRLRMVSYANEALAAIPGTGDQVGVMQIDLDHFKDINDTFGHAAGDALLCHVVEKVQSCLRRSDLLARPGGDEFVVICPQIETLDTLERIAQDVQKAIGQPLIWDDKTINASASIGVALSRHGKCGVDGLLHRADVALYEAKRNGRGQIGTFDLQSTDNPRDMRGVRRKA